jgi:hypothetical protein
MEAENAPEASVNFYQTTRRNNPDDSHLHPSALLVLAFPVLPILCMRKIKINKGLLLLISENLKIPSELILGGRQTDTYMDSNKATTASQVHLQCRLREVS